jgi:hypothetical protein
LRHKSSEPLIFLRCALGCLSTQQTNIWLLGAPAREPSASGKDLLNASFGTTTQPLLPVVAPG